MIRRAKLWFIIFNLIDVHLLIGRLVSCNGLLSGHGQWNTVVCCRYLVQQELSEILWGLQGAWVLALKISCQLLYKVFSRYLCIICSFILPTRCKARLFLQTRAGFIKGMAQGTSSLLSNTVYALSDAATQFSKAAHKVLLHQATFSNSVFYLTLILIHFIV